MPTINISVVEKIATNMTPDVNIVCGNSDYNIIFAFDSEWEGIEGCKARFVLTSNGKQEYIDVDIIDNTVRVPALSGTTAVHVGVFGGHLRATTPARIPCEYSVRCM